MKSLLFRVLSFSQTPIPITPGTMTNSGFCLFVSDVRRVYLVYLQFTLSPHNWRAASYSDANATHVHTL